MSATFGLIILGLLVLAVIVSVIIMIYQATIDPSYNPDAKHYCIGCNNEASKCKCGGC